MGKNMKIFCLLGVLFGALGTAQAGELYRIELMRAAPGKLIEVIDRLNAASPESAGKNGPFVLRHSQGDQWDLMVVTPVGDYSHYFSRVAILARRAATRSLGLSLAQNLAWREDVFMYGPARAVFATRYSKAGFFHIEMFQALAGHSDKLLQQRAMENDYLRRIGRQQNLIFRRDLGAAWDVMTIGFYSDLKDFSSSVDIPPEAENRAAKAAGFEAANRIGSYLRTLINRHNDTLAVRAF